MLKNTFILFLFCTLTSVAQQTKTALFLGNSYTYVNNLPLLVKSIATSKGDTFTFDQNTPGGHSLQGHASNPTSLAKIKSQNWDYVILQDQSQRPAFDSAYVATNVFPYASALADSIRSNSSCTIPLYFMTWGRKNGDQQNCAAFPPVCTYLGMQNRLRASYIEMAQQNNAEVSPVGVSWKTVRAADTLLNLYSGDGSHPNMNGSYLAACTFYASMFHKSPVGAWRPSGIDSTTAYFLQFHANNTVFDSLNVWQIDTLYPIPSVTFTIVAGSGNNCTVYFDATNTQHADSIYWDFNDGGFASGFQPSHTFTTPGPHSATLELWHGCDAIIYNEPLGALCNISIKENESRFAVYPNPAQTVLKIESANGNAQISFSILTLNGQSVVSSVARDGKIDVHFLENGIYILRLEENGAISYLKFIKN